MDVKVVRYIIKVSFLLFFVVCMVVLVVVVFIGVVGIIMVNIYWGYIVLSFLQNDCFIEFRYNYMRQVLINLKVQNLMFKEIKGIVFGVVVGGGVFGVLCKGIQLRWGYSLVIYCLVSGVFWFQIVFVQKIYFFLNRIKGLFVVKLCDYRVVFILKYCMGQQQF